MKFLLSSCELLALPSLDSVSEHISTGRRSCEQNKVLGRRGSQLSGLGRLRVGFFSPPSHLSEQLKLQNEAANAEVA